MGLLACNRAQACMHGGVPVVTAVTDAEPCSRQQVVGAAGLVLHAQGPMQNHAADSRL